MNPRLSDPSVDLLLLTERMSDLEDTVRTQAAVIRRQEAHLVQILGALARLHRQRSGADTRLRDATGHADQFGKRLIAAFTHAIGASRLPPQLADELLAAFTARMPPPTEPAARAGFLARYEALDQTLIDEFVTDYINGEWLTQVLKDLNGDE